MTESSDRRPALGGLLRGRDSELAVLGECLSGVARGEAGMLLVEGPAGIGKSSLLAEARVIAGRVGVRALFGDASESREAVPFAPLLDATLGSDPPIGERESARMLSEQPYWMLHELQGALEAAALERPLVVVLDDLHWADSGTLGALTALPARLVGSPILWILARRGDEGRARVRESMARLERGVPVVCGFPHCPSRRWRRWLRMPWVPSLRLVCWRWRGALRASRSCWSSCSRGCRRRIGC